MTGSSLRSNQAKEYSESVLGQPPAREVGIHEPAGVPELVDRGIRDHVRVLLVRHPVVPKLGVVDVRKP